MSMCSEYSSIITVAATLTTTTTTQFLNDTTSACKSAYELIVVRNVFLKFKHYAFGVDLYVYINYK